MANIEIDGNTYAVTDGKNILEACLDLGLDLPYFCWHPAMGSVGSCRQCAVRVYADAEDQRGRLLMGCMTPVKDGLRLSIKEKSVSEFRDKCIEVTMANHPHDCPVCEEGGECHLQDVTIMSNHTERRYRGDKKTYENQNLGPCINHEMNRCITCYRCVRFYDNYAGGNDLVALASRENTYFGRHEDGCLESVFSGNLVEVCPTGVFTDKTLARSYNRKWDLQAAPSICHGCSVGCNIAPSERQGKIKRITNRYHGQVNGYFICDKGRFGYDHTDETHRITQSELGQRPVSYQQAIESATKNIYQSKRLIGVGSETASMEENYLLKTLVGANNFCSGLSEARQLQYLEILNIYQNAIVDITSLKDIESCDATLILGEDLLNSAPRMALSVRQATRNKAFAMAKDAGIPAWQDDSVRILAQDEKSPLIIASVGGTELDDIASEPASMSPQNVANFAFAVAHHIDASLPCAALPEALNEAAKRTAKALLAATKPLIISGTGLNSLAVIQGAAQIAAALSAKRQGSAINMSFVLPEANSMGLALLIDEQSLCLEKMLQVQGAAVITMQNDLYQCGDGEKIDAFFSQSAYRMAISQLSNRTTLQADSLIPATSFVETEGTLVNQEGRAQRFFSVFATENPELKDNWRSLVSIAQQLVTLGALQPGLTTVSELSHFDQVVEAMQNQGGWLSQWESIAPGSKFRIAGMKIPRQPHRYSGRTSLKADVNVAEKKQPQDPDSALGYTMEGAPAQVPSELNALVWSPGWNSNEAVHKFQSEIGGALKGGDPGILLINQKHHSAIRYGLPQNLEPDSQKTLVAVSQARIFDDSAATILSSAIAQRAQPRLVMMHEQTGKALKFSAHQTLTVSVNGHCVSLPLAYNNRLPINIVTVPGDIHTGLDLPAALLPAVCTLEATANA